MRKDYQAKFRETVTGDHLIVIYEDAAELLAFAVPYVVEGLAKGERILYVLDDLSRQELVDALTAGGVNVVREIERGALVLMSPQEYYQLPLELTHMMQLTRDRLREAQSLGFSGLRVAAEMTWKLKTDIPDDTLCDYEELLDVALGAGAATVACAYRSGRFPTPVLRQLIRAHGKVVARDEIFLNLSGIFQALAQTDLQALMASAQDRRIQKDGFFFRQGDPATEVFVLTSGRIKIVRGDSDGGNVILRLVAPPKPFGHITALAGTPRLASAQAVEDSRALVWDVPTVLKAMAAHPEVTLNTVHLMAKQLTAVEERLIDLATAPVERRLARFLHRAAGAMGRTTAQGVIIDLGLSGEELAGLLNTTPFTISRILAQWRRDQLLSQERNRFLLHDDARLAAIASETGSKRSASN